MLRAAPVMKVRRPECDEQPSKPRSEKSAANQLTTLVGRKWPPRVERMTGPEGSLIRSKALPPTVSSSRSADDRDYRRRLQGVQHEHEPSKHRGQGGSKLVSSGQSLNLEEIAGLVPNRHFPSEGAKSREVALQ
jgi:hypothetical protein